MDRYAVFTLQLFLMLCVIVTCIPYLINLFWFSTTIVRLISLDDKLTITAYASGISAENNNGSDFYRWEQIKRIVNTSNYIKITLTNKNILLIPKRDFTTIEAGNLFLYKITNGLQGVKNPGKAPRKLSPSYLWGLLGLIPVLGAFNGLIMILMGVFQYRDYKYCFIGLMGVIATIGFFKYTEFTTTHNPQASGLYADMAQKDLNDLVKSIEFYKFENKQYPDSLQQLDSLQPLASINDPILTFRHMHEDGKRLFYYKRLGNKYTLFSSGLDEVPHTKDDIYPSVTISDSSKIGLIRVK